MMLAGALMFAAGYVLGLATWQAIELWRDWRRDRAIREIGGKR